MARELVPKPGFGQALYDLITARRRPQGTAWKADDLAEAIRKDYEVSPKQIREWITGRASPPVAGLVAVAAYFAVDAVQLWKGVIEPINLPQDGRSRNGRATPQAEDDEARRARDRAAAEKAAEQARSAASSRRARRKSS